MCYHETLSTLSHCGLCITRTVVFENMHELKGGRAGFRAIHDDRPKLYQVALCEDMRGPAEIDDQVAGVCAKAT